MSILRGYLVVHEVKISDDRTDHGAASSLYEYERADERHSALEAAENQLAYCEALQKKGHPGSDGRYFIAEYREVTQ